MSDNMDEPLVDHTSKKLDDYHFLLQVVSCIQGWPRASYTICMNNMNTAAIVFITSTSRIPMFDNMFIPSEPVDANNFHHLKRVAGLLTHQPEAFIALSRNLRPSDEFMSSIKEYTVFPIFDAIGCQDLPARIINQVKLYPAGACVQDIIKDVHDPRVTSTVRSMLARQQLYLNDQMKLVVRDECGHRMPNKNRPCTRPIGHPDNHSDKEYTWT